VRFAFWKVITKILNNQMYVTYLSEPVSVSDTTATAIGRFFSQIYFGSPVSLCQVEQ
jgi:hypothetical protein